MLFLPFLGVVFAQLPQGAHRVKHSDIFSQTYINTKNPVASNFKPSVTRINGCEPYPAVDFRGNWSGGLKASRGDESNCDDFRKRQVYSRTAESFKDLKSGKMIVCHNTC